MKENKIIILISIIVPVVVASLFRIKLDVELPIFLPPIYAAINAFTAILLIISVWAIKNNKIVLHQNLMQTAIGLSIVFLILYILHHATHGDTKFGGQGAIRYFYFFILISHIILSIIVIPFVLITFVRAKKGKFELHKKVARIAYPIWLYVAVSGVFVYLLISPYYQ
jgi:putative membrane protein